MNRSNIGGRLLQSSQSLCDPSLCNIKRSKIDGPAIPSNLDFLKENLPLLRKLCHSLDNNLLANFQYLFCLAD